MQEAGTGHDIQPRQVACYHRPVRRFQFTPNPAQPTTPVTADHRCRAARTLSRRRMLMRELQGAQT